MTDEIIGKKIVAMRLMTPIELEREGWSGMGNTMCLVLEDGSILYSSGDSEGNHPGALFGFANGKTIAFF